MGNRNTHVKPQPHTVCSPSLHSEGMNLLHSKIDALQHERRLYAAQKIITAAANLNNKKKQNVRQSSVIIPSNADNASMEGALVLVHFQKSNIWYPGKCIHCKPASFDGGCALVDVFFDE